MRCSGSIGGFHCANNLRQKHRHRSSILRSLRLALGPDRVKTCTSRECGELFSLFSSFSGDCQSGSFVIQRNRDKLSTRKLDVGVFTQPGSFSDVDALPHGPLHSKERTSSALPYFRKVPTPEVIGRLTIIKRGRL